MIAKPAQHGTETVTNADPSTHPAEDDAVGPPGTPSDVSAPTRMGRGWRWLLLIALAAAAWYYRAEWLPWIPPGLIGGTAPAAKPAPSPSPTPDCKVAPKDQKKDCKASKG